MYLFGDGLLDTPVQNIYQSQDQKGCEIPPSLLGSLTFRTALYQHEKVDISESSADESESDVHVLSIPNTII